MGKPLSMPMEDFLAMPKGYTFESWKKELTRRKGVRTRLLNLSNDIDFLEDGLKIIESGTKKYKQFEDLLAKKRKKRDEIIEKEVWLE